LSDVDAVLCEEIVSVDVAGTGDIKVGLSVREDVEYIATGTGVELCDVHIVGSPGEVPDTDGFVREMFGAVWAVVGIFLVGMVSGGDPVGEGLEVEFDLVVFIVERVCGVEVGKRRCDEEKFVGFVPEQKGVVAINI
jgi:hypothetical protein